VNIEVVTCERVVPEMMYCAIEQSNWFCKVCLLTQPPSFPGEAAQVDVWVVVEQVTVTLASSKAFGRGTYLSECAQIAT